MEGKQKRYNWEVVFIAAWILIVALLVFFLFDPGFVDANEAEGEEPLKPVALEIRNETPFTVTFSYVRAWKGTCTQSTLPGAIDVGLKLRPGEVTRTHFLPAYVKQKYHVMIHAAGEVKFPTIGCNVDLVRGTGDWIRFIWVLGDQYITPEMNPAFMKPDA